MKFALQYPFNALSVTHYIILETSSDHVAVRVATVVYHSTPHSAQYLICLILLPFQDTKISIFNQPPISSKSLSHWL